MYTAGRVCVVWAGFKLDAFVVFRLFICESSAGGAQSYAAILIEIAKNGYLRTGQPIESLNITIKRASKLTNNYLT